MSQLHDYEKLILDAMPIAHLEISSYDLLHGIECHNRLINGETLRAAYWHLVSSGRIERTARGVRIPRENAPDATSATLTESRGDPRS